MSSTYGSMTQPHFIGIGAQKAGTSWLAAQLQRHPGVWMSPIKELHYFDKLDPVAGHPTPPLEARMTGDARWRRRVVQHLRRLAHEGPPELLAWWTACYLGDCNDDWYRSLFACVPPGRIAGEFTPRYAICTPWQIARMHAVAPAARLLFVLREPVARFWSQCKMKQGRTGLPLDEAGCKALFDDHNGRIRGQYSLSLGEFCRHYTTERILVVFYDAIRARPDEVMTAVFDFLGLPDMTLRQEDLAAEINVSPVRSLMPESVRHHVRQSYDDELRRLATAFGGYALGWRGGDVPADSPVAVRLTRQHVARLAGAD